MELAKGVELLTLNDPDADPPQDEAFLRQLVAGVKRRKVGRRKQKVLGEKKRLRRRWQKQVVKMREEGVTYREIADRIFAADGLTVTPATVRNWFLSPNRHGRSRHCPRPAPRS
jgi:hypothetical protein